MSTLMYMDTPVFNRTTRQVLRSGLMPCAASEVESWLKRRSFLATNRLSEQSAAQHSPHTLVRTRRFSLSDSYWVHRNGDKATFQSASPYLNDFTEYGVCVSDKSVPDAELGGSFTKCWRRDSKTGQTFIVKYMPQNMVDSERAALILAAQLELPCAKEYTAWQQPNSIAIENLTTHGKMLLPLGGKLKYGYSFRAVQGLFSQMGVAQCELILRTILFDAVVANYDRYENGSNWARMAVEANGSLSFHVSPMYDFNLAHRGTDNPYLRSIAETGIAGSSAKAILDEWQPVIAAFDDSCWLKNLTTLYKLVS